MSALQWALLIVGVAVVVLVYFVSRREKPSRSQSRQLTAPVVTTPRNPGGDQMEIFSSTGEFDEFGVGKKRTRVPPVMPGIPSPKPVAEKPVPELKLEVQTQPAASRAAAARKTRHEPELGPAAAAAPSPKPEAVATPQEEQKIIAILVAEREGTAILGPKLHRALQQQALVFGERSIYHRIDRSGQPVFSVAGLLKPGQLDPEEAETFSTPGLTMFMVLPGPADPEAVLADLLATARALARSMNAELFDTRRQPFTAKAEQAMIIEVRDWALRHA
ncbi:MAG TPA: cell division protein ZipA C-terminal FtsZ-binding domain-containing protein [Stenotrophobium sp.]|nr:cell division protein ZipA C-terminal FtsZ-binding domain-containing protein [Stenotrophobium sp.]